MSTFDPLRLLLGLGLSFAIGGLGYARHSLTRSGWLGAVLVGTASIGLGGWIWGLLVVVFFVSSSALSHWRKAAKARIAADKFSKDERRDLAQTLANGGGVVLLALLHALWPQPWLFPAALGVLATVTADTWATELGTLSRARPWLITNGRPVPPGTSGGITALGLAATAGGGLLIGVVAWAAARLGGDTAAAWMVLAALGGGSLGSLFDSLLGATVQAIAICPRCGAETERAVHSCGTPTRHLRGWRWLDNDWVNFIAALVGGLGAVLLWLAQTA